MIGTDTPVLLVSVVVASIVVTSTVVVVLVLVVLVLVMVLMLVLVLLVDTVVKVNKVMVCGMVRTMRMKISKSALLCLYRYRCVVYLVR